MDGKEVTITSEDGSGNVTTRKVKITVTKTLAEEHPITGKTINVTVGDKLPELTKLVEITDKDKLKQNPTLKWNGSAPKTDTVGVFTHGIKGTYSDNSTSITKPVVTINVKPKKPVIETDLTNLAGKKGQKVTVSVGSGIPEGTITTVKLFGKDNKEIGSTTTIKDGKAEITVKDGIPEGDVYATTTVKKPDKKGPKTTIPGFELTSEKSDTRQATAPKDTKAPTITVTATSSPVTVGQDLKIHIVATDDVKVEEINYIQALTGAKLLQDTDITSGRASVSKTTDTDQEQVLDLTVTNMQPKEVGTHTLTFTVTDSAGKTGTATLTITVKPAAPTITTPTSGSDQGSATITPADGTDTLEITYTPEGETTTKTITVKKGTDGKWKIDGNTPEGVTVNENDGKVTIPANKIKDGSKVTAKDKNGNNTSDEATGQTGTNPSTTPETKKPAAPTITTPTSGSDQGSATITPADGTDTLEITYTPEGETTTKTITVKKGTDGKWKIDGNTPEGVTVNENDGKVTIPANKIKDGSKVTAKDKNGNNTSDEATGQTGTNPSTTPETKKPAAPTITTPTSGSDQGSATITPADGTDTLEITYTPEGETTTKTITVKKGTDGKWKIDGNTPEGVTVNENDGKVTIPANKIKDGSKVTAKDKNGNNTSDEATGQTGTNPSTTPETKKPAAPTITTPTSGSDQGSATITPADGTDTLEITYTPEGETTTKTITVKKGTDGKWKIDGNTPEGVTVNENDGKVTIPANKIKDGSKVTAKDKNGNNTSDEATGQTGTNPSTTPETKKPAAPTITTPTSGSDQGSATITPADGTDTLEITYTPEGETTTKTITVKKGTDGKWKIDGNTPEGVTVNENDGKVTIPANKIKDGSKVTAKDKNGNNTSDEATGQTGTNPSTTPETKKPAAPTITTPTSGSDQGSATITPADGTDTLEITYTPEGETTTKTITVKKGTDGKWKIDGNTPEGVTVNENDGKVTIPANKIKDGSKVTAKDKNGNNTSDEATGQTGTNPSTTPETKKPAAPTITTPTSGSDQGSATITPADGTDTLEITYTPEGETTTKTITVKKGTDGKWKIDGNTPEGVTVNENDGKVTIPANKIKDGSKVTAKDKNGNNTSDEATGQTGTNPSTTPETKKPAAPTITTPTSGSDQGSATITPADGTDTLEITYTPEGETTTKTITVKKGTDGKWKIDGNTPEGVTVNENDGKVTIPANKIKDGSKVTAKDKNGNNTSDEATGQTGTNPSTTPETKKPAAPTITTPTSGSDQGSATITPADGTDTLEITYTPEGETTTKTITVKKGTDGKWKIDGNTPEGVTVNENDGKVTIPANKIKDGSKVTAKDKNGNNTSDEATGQTGTNPSTTPETKKPAAPTITTPTSGSDQGSATITPADGTDTLEITYTPEGETTTKTITVKKGTDGKWKIDGNTPEGVTVNENDGKVTIPANKIKDGSKVTAKDKNGNNTSDEATGQTGTNPSTTPETKKPAAPTITTPTSGSDQGSATITPADGTDTLEITYTPEGETTTKTITVKKGTDGKWKIDGNTPEGVTVNENDGKVTIPANKIKDGSKVTAKDKNGNNTSDEATGQTGTNPSTTPETKKPAAPTITTPTSGSDQGSATITPADGTDTLEITYTPEGETTTKTITVKKGTDGKWKIDGNTPEGVTVNENDGKVTIPANKIKDGSKVTAKDKNGNNTSDEATGQTGTNPSTTPETKKPAAPTITTPTSGSDQGSATITPADGTDTLEITYTPEGETTTKTITVKKGTDGKWKIDGNTPEGVTVNENDGKVTIPANKIKDGSKVTAKDKNGNNTSDEATGQTGTNPSTTPETKKPAAPTITTPTSGSDQGSATITPADGTDTLEITYTPEGETTTKTITVKKGTDGKWKIDGNTPEGVTVNENDGKVTIPANKIKDGSKVTAKDKNGNNTSDEATGQTGTNPSTTPETKKPAAPTITTPTSGSDQGSATITPADGTDTLEITYTPEGETTTKTITVKKGTDGKWKIDGNTPEGVTVNENDGKVTIPANKIKDGSKVTAKDKNGNNTSDEATGQTGTNPSTTPETKKPAAPTITTPTSGSDQGSATITPADGTDTLEITYTPEGETTTKTITVKKGTDGKWKIDGNTPEGVTVNENDGKVTIPANKIKDGSKVTAKDKNGNNTSDEATGQTGTNPSTTPETKKPAAPTITTPTSGSDQGSATITPADGTDTLEITYTPEGETTTKTITVKKGTDGKWKIDGNTPEGVTVNENDGKVTIPANKIKDGSKVTAKDKNGNNTSDEATGNAGNNNGNSGSGTGSGSDSGNDSTSNNGGSDSGSTTGGSSSTDSGAQNSTNESSSADNANNAGNTETGNAGNSKAGNASTGASGSNASTKSGNKVPAKHSSQLVKTGAEVERAGLISAMIGVLGAAAAFFSRKKNRE
ncbi:hypothetical protein [Gardnerella sp. 2492-Sm]|uniref:beta strand repeat-containing protein n=1 Tax=unclassified Gardnerella TaxID=2628112 RepID=UPI003D064153